MNEMFMKQMEMFQQQMVKSQERTEKNMEKNQEQMEKYQELLAKNQDLILNELREFKREVRLRFDEVDKRFTKVDERFDEVDERFVGVDERFDKQDEWNADMLRAVLQNRAMIEDTNKNVNLLVEGHKALVEDNKKLKGQPKHDNDIAVLNAVVNKHSDEIAKNTYDIKKLKEAK